MYTYLAVSEKGKAKKVNEDRVFIDGALLSRGIRRGSAETLLAAVCDGVGGESGGDIASTDTAAGFLLFDPKDSDPKSLLRHLEQTNRLIQDEQTVYPEYGRMATTVAGIVLHGREFNCFNLGDSRVYLFSKGKLIQLSEDHTVAHLKARYRCITAEETASEEDRNTLTRWIGTSGQLRYPSFVSGKAEGGNVCFVLCSDGIHKNLSHSQMESILRKDCSLEKKKEFILQKAKVNGCRDDISLILLELASSDTNLSGKGGKAMEVICSGNRYEDAIPSVGKCTQEPGDKCWLNLD